MVLAASTSVAGFGALSAFWFLGEWRQEVPGLFDYRSAVLGDGALLRIVVAILYGVLRACSLVAVPHEPAWATVSALAGGAVGALTQAAWLFDDSPALNWSFPRAHHFNAAGWYHAGFLTCASGLVTAFAVLAGRRIRAKRHGDPDAVRDVARSPWLGLLFGAAVALAGLIAIDNTRASGTHAGDATAAALSGATVGGLLLMGWAFGPALRAATPPIATGSVAAGMLYL